MASPGEIKLSNQSEGSGKETLEYRKVQANLVKINATLRANVEAERVLRQTFEQKGWIEMGTDTPGNKLMTVVLDRIKLSPDTYEEFMEMLGNIKGLDLIKVEIEDTTCKFHNIFPNLSCTHNTHTAL